MGALGVTEVVTFCVGGLRCWRTLHMPLTTVNRTPPSLSAATALRLAQARYLSGSGGFRQMTPRFPPGKIFEGLDPGRYDTSPRAIRPHSPRATCILASAA